VGSCLANQIYDLKVSDAARIASGMAPQYLVSRYLNGGSNTVRVNSSATQSLNRVQLELPVDQISTSLMTLEVAADSLRFVQNSSPGKVRRMCTNFACGVQAEPCDCMVNSAACSKACDRRACHHRAHLVCVHGSFWRLSPFALLCHTVSDM
jgi:Male gamete fusion factor